MVEDFEKIRYLFLKRRMKKQKKYEEEIKKFDDELFDMYYKTYERIRIKEYGEGSINKSENEILEIDAYYEWCDKIISMQPQLKKEENRYRLLRNGLLPIITGGAMIVAAGLGFAPAEVAIVGAGATGAGVVQAIKHRHEQKHYYLNRPSRGRYYYTHICNNKPVEMRLGYRKQVSERFASEHHLNASQKML